MRPTVLHEVAVTDQAATTAVRECSHPDAGILGYLLSIHLSGCTNRQRVGFEILCVRYSKFARHITKIIQGFS